MGVVICCGGGGVYGLLGWSEGRLFRVFLLIGSRFLIYCDGLVFFF